MKIPYKRHIYLIQIISGITYIVFGFYYVMYLEIIQGYIAWLYYSCFFVGAFGIFDGIIKYRYGCLYIDKDCITRRKLFYTEKIHQKKVMSVVDSKQRIIVKSKRRAIVILKNQISQASINTINEQVEWIKNQSIKRGGNI